MNGIIDVHIHPYWHDDPFDRMTEVIRLARKVGIEKLVVLGGNLGFGYRPNEAQVTQINDLTIELARRWPEELIGFCRISAGLKSRFLRQEIGRCFATGLFKGIKLAVSPNARSRRLDPVMRKAEELDAVVLHHCWYKTVKRYAGESDPSDIADLAARFPRVKIIMPHVTGCGHRGMLDVQPFGNVYVDTSGSQASAGMVEYAVEVLGVERVLYGSDAFGRDFAPQLGRIFGAKLTPAQRVKILRTNAVQLLGL